MNRTFTTDPSQFNAPRLQGIKRVIISVIGVMSFFLIISLLKNDTNYTILFITFGIMILCSLLGVFIASLYNYPSNNTIIEINEEGITRSGDELLTVRIKFNQIEKIINKNSGLIIIKKGVSSLNYQLNKNALISEFGIIYIPSIMIGYDELTDYINKKHDITL